MKTSDQGHQSFPARVGWGIPCRVPHLDLEEFMRQITYICDFCGYKELDSVPASCDEKKILFPLGYREGCHQCIMKAGQHLGIDDAMQIGEKKLQ